MYWTGTDEDYNYVLVMYEFHPCTQLIFGRECIHIHTYTRRYKHKHTHTQASTHPYDNLMSYIEQVQYVQSAVLSQVQANV